MQRLSLAFSCPYFFPGVLAFFLPLLSGRPKAAFAVSLGQIRYAFHGEKRHQMTQIPVAAKRAIAIDGIDKSKSALLWTTKDKTAKDVATSFRTKVQCICKSPTMVFRLWQVSMP